MEPKECYNALLARKLIEEFRTRNIEGFYCRTKEEALQKVLEIIPEGSTVSWGGSATLGELGVAGALKPGRYDVLDPNAVQGGAAKDEVAHQALGADYYLMSSNAISATGELVNADGYGNRVASLIFGPKHVIVVAGLNKVEPDLDAAILRVKNRAAQLTLLIFKRDYASFAELAEAGEGAYSHLVITRMSTNKDRIKVILVGESLGF